MHSYLRSARINSGKTIEEIASHLRIKKEYLLALEESNFSLMPGEIYARGYLKLYADYLGLSLESTGNNVKFCDQPTESLDKETPSAPKYKIYVAIISAVLLVLTILLYDSITK